MSQQAMVSMSSNLVELECSACGKKYDASKEQHLCTCGKPLLVRYDLRRAAATLAKRLGVKALAAPTAGNAGGALAAYAAAAGIPAVIVMPADTPFANVMECQAFGAKVVKLNGLISDCGKYVAENKDREGWYDVSTLKEPYRVEGKKTMGYELWEQCGGKLPQVIFYPTGGGVGLI